MTDLPATTSNRSLRKTIILLIALIAIIVVVVGVLCLYVGRTTAERKDHEYAEIVAEWERKYQDLVNNPIMVEPITPEVDLSIVNSKLQAIGELATMEYLYTDANRFSDAKKFLGVKFASKSFVAKWDGVIKAGFDVDKITADVDKDTKTITVFLPDPRILSHEILMDSIETLDESSGIFNPIKVDDVNSFYEVSKDAMEKRAKENGIFIKAIANAEEIISNLLLSVPGITDEYAVNFKLLY